jgi:hypothetical protein
VINADIEAFRSRTDNMSVLSIGRPATAKTRPAHGGWVFALLMHLSASPTLLAKDGCGNNPTEHEEENNSGVQSIVRVGVEEHPKDDKGGKGYTS